ncbi:MAG: TRAP transporter small permease [Syntrophorhabdus sp.]|jgi:TRAP-type C4-dicarboxylate transport system permease small subunit|nr:TRAP transporter small permease [Syntrophorhabdus sp.]
MRYLDTFNNFCNKVLLFLGGISVLALMLLATGNVVLRVFHLPFRGTYEIVSFLGAVVIAFALGYTQKRKDHIVVDILTEKFPEPLKNLIDKVAYLAITLFFGVVSWQLYVWGMKIWESSEVSETLKIVFHPYVFMVAVGFALLSFTAFIDFLKKLFHEEN